MQKHHDAGAKTRRFGIGFTVLASLFALAQGWHETRRLESISTDLLYRHFNRATAASRKVVAIDIDEQTIKLLAPRLGRWPWPRSIYREALEFLRIGGAKAVFFDILFSEPGDPAGDAELVGASTVGVSHAANFLRDRVQDKAGSEPLPRAWAEKTRLSVKASQPLSDDAQPDVWRDYALPIEPLRAIARTHFVNVEPDRDGNVRRVPLLFRYQGEWFGSLALRALRGFDGADGPLTFTADELRLADGRAIPLDGRGQFPVHYYRTDRGPERIGFGAVIASAAKLQSGAVEDPSQLEVNPMEFRDKWVLIGGSAVGLHDLKATPLHSDYPGLLIQATAVANLLEGDFLREVPALGQRAAAVGFIALTYAVAVFSSSLLGRLAVPPLLAAVYALVGALLFRLGNWHLALFLPMAVGLLGWLEASVSTSVREIARRRQMESTLSKYLSPAVTSQLISEGLNPRAEVGKKTELSVLFSDVRGFTTLSEHYDPRALVALLNAYLGRMTDVIFDSHGTLDKFIGDAVMAFWGAPLPDAEHAARSIRCGLAMQRALEALNRDWAAAGERAQLKAGIGINTGDVIVGNIGSERRLDYTVIGDNVNLASRIEGLTKQYGVGLLVAESTWRQSSGIFFGRLVEPGIRVKGKDTATRLYQPLGEIAGKAESPYTKLVESFEAALGLYLHARFADAARAFTVLADQWKDGPSALLAERCRELQARTPKDWDGTYAATSK